jgi:site-specific recombinase XerD
MATMKYLTEKEEKHLLKTVREIKGLRAERDRMIVELLLGTGLRASELVGLDVGDVRGKEKLFVRPEIAKGKKGRFIPVSVDLQRRVKSFMALKLAGKESIRDDAPLFMSRNDQRLSKRSLQELVEKAMLRAGLTTTEDGQVVPLYSTHSLRHTCFKRMQERGVQMTTIQKIAGHATVASTGIYTEATWEEMVDAVEARG